LGADDRREEFLEFRGAPDQSAATPSGILPASLRQSDAVTAEGLKEILWLTPDRCEMTENDWNQEFARCLGVYLAAPQSERAAPRQAISDSNFLLLVECTSRDDSFQDRSESERQGLLTVLDTASAEDPFAQKPLTSETYPLQGRSLVLCWRNRSGMRMSVQWRTIWTR